MAFQKKNWSDDDITIKYLEFLHNMVYPGMKVGISMDMTPVHIVGKMLDYIKNNY